jgi:hypothetical protein
MELLDRYLEAVRRHLPWKRQDDIVAELKTNLEAQLEEREAELGRPMTAAESADWIRQLGPPFQMAARYQPQQYLIGPSLYPSFRYVLRLGLTWCFVVYCIVSAVDIVVNSPSPDAVVGAVFHLPVVLMITAAWITLAFAIVEFLIAANPFHFPNIAEACSRWIPEHLPPTPPRAAAGHKPRSYAQAVAEFVVGFIVLVWLLLIPHHPYLLFGPGAAFIHASPYRPAPVWWTFYWWIVSINCIQQIWRIYDLLTGAWVERNRLQQMVTSALGLIPCTLVLSAPALVLLKHPAADAARYGATLDTINLWAHRGFLIVLILSVLTLIGEAVKWVVDEVRMSRAAMR